MIKFDKLWETAQAKGISNNALHEKYNISKAQLSRLRHNEGVTTCTVDRLCNLLECDISDIMEHIAFISIVAHNLNVEAHWQQRIINLNKSA